MVVGQVVRSLVMDCHYTTKQEQIRIDCGTSVCVLSFANIIRYFACLKA